MRKRPQSKLNLLTVRQIQTLGAGDHSDGGGLLLRISEGGASFVFRYTAPTGKRREMGLGPAWRNNAAQAGNCLTSARELAAHQRALMQKGLDPIDERARGREDAKQRDADAKANRQREQLTLARAARDYHERVIEPSRTAKHGAQWISSLENHVKPEVWNAPISSITAPVLLDLLIDLHQKVPETAKRVRQRLESVFEDAVFRGLCGTNPAAATRRKMREAKGRQEKGAFAMLPFAEAPAFMARLGEARGIAARCLEFALLTAGRTGEVIAAEWSEFDLDGGVWVVPAARMKAKEAHTVYLSAQALEVLEGQKGLDERYVFPTPMLSGRPLSNMAMLTLLDRMGMRERTTVHGLCRATFSTWANETGAARGDVIEACLAHKESDHVRRAYNRAQFNAERKALLAAWASYLNGAAKSAKIIALKVA